MNNACWADETTQCVSDADCAGLSPTWKAGHCGHAGKRDWRIPNIDELKTLIGAPFLLINCAPGCSADPPGEALGQEGCSCNGLFYWSADTRFKYPGDPDTDSAWYVSWSNGQGIPGTPEYFVGWWPKGAELWTRAVRGGL